MGRSSKISYWKSETVFHDGDSYFQEIQKAISKAVHSIDLEFFIFEKDTLGLKILSLLETAAQKGIRVRILVDGIGCANWNYLWVKNLLNRGLKVRVYHPLPWQAASIFEAVLGLFKINRRDHRKLVLIDRREVFVGGMNISSCHLKSLSGDRSWRDSAVYLRGIGVKFLQKSFDRVWTKSFNKNQKVPVSIRLNDTWRLRRDSKKKLFNFINSAAKKLWIATPYFNPDISLMRALINRARAGVDVRIMLPNKSDVKHVSLISKTLYGLLLKSGVKIYEYLPSVLHCKITLSDDRAMIGTTNFNQRSFFFDLEVDVMLVSNDSIQSIERQFETDFKASQAVDFNMWIKRGWISKLNEKIATLIRYWS